LKSRILGVIVNLNARKNKKLVEQGVNLKEQFQGIINDWGILRLTHDLRELPMIAQEFKERKIEILAISGGDGTNQHVLTAFWRAYGWQLSKLKLLFLRGGTMNTLANSLGVIKGKQEEILKGLVAKIRQGEKLSFTEWDTLKVNDEIGYFFGMGLVSNFLDFYYDSSLGEPSILKAVKLFISGIGSTLIHGDLAQKFTRWLKAEINIEGNQCWQTNYSVIAAGTAESLGLGTKPLSLARKKPGHFQFLCLSLKPIFIVWRLPKFYLGLKIKEKSGKVICRLAQRVLIKTKEPYKYTLDGEMNGGPTEFLIETGPRMKVIKG